MATAAIAEAKAAQGSALQIALETDMITEAPS
jgi:hypothetical protein